MKYRCRKCGKEFSIPATISYSPTIALPGDPPLPPTAVPWPFGGTSQTVKVTYNYSISQPCCPYCYSADIEEVGV